MTKKWQNGLALLVSIALVCLVDVVGRYYAPDAWYTELAKPSSVIPPWAYPYIWVPAYLLNAVCVWLVWLSRSKQKDVFGAVVFYLVQLILNMQWSNIFFGLHRIDFAFYEILVFLLFVVLTNVMFWRVNRLAGALYVPYTLLVTYLVWVNYQFLLLNP